MDVEESENEAKVGLPKGNPTSIYICTVENNVLSSVKLFQKFLIVLYEGGDYGIA